MLSWIKKRCRRKSAPSCGIHKFTTDPTYFVTQNEAVDHEYEDIGDGITPCELAYAIVNLTDRINAEDAKETNINEICPVCRCGRNRTSTTSMKCCCDASESDDYEIPECFFGLPCSTPEDPEQDIQKKKRADFSKRPLPELPAEFRGRCRNPISTMKNFAEFSYSDESSNSSGYFDSSYMSQTDSSSDDSFINDFEKMAIRHKEMVCRKNCSTTRQKPQQSPPWQPLQYPSTPRQREQCPSPPRPRMGCRVLTTSSMIRAHPSSRSHTMQPQFAIRGQGQSSCINQTLMRGQGQTPFRKQNASAVNLNQSMYPTPPLRSVSSSRLQAPVASRTPGLTLPRDFQSEEDLYEDIF